MLEKERVQKLTDESLLKAIASTLLDNIMKSEFYNDAEDNINFNDPETKQDPRDENDIEKMESLIEKEKDDILDELVELLKEKGYDEITKITDNVHEVRKIIDEEYKKYRRRSWDAIKSEFPS